MECMTDFGMFSRQQISKYKGLVSKINFNEPSIGILIYTIYIETPWIVTRRLKPLVYIRYAQPRLLHVVHKTVQIFIQFNCYAVCTTVHTAHWHRHRHMLNIEYNATPPTSDWVLSICVCVCVRSHSSPFRPYNVCLFEHTNVPSTPS